MSSASTTSRPFVVLTTQRSGSVLLVQALRSHPDVWCHHEMYKRTHKSADSYRAFLARRPSRRVMQYVMPMKTCRSYLAELTSSPAGKQVVGFKLMYNHLRRHPELRRVIAEDRIDVLHLVRENVLRTEVSARRAETTGTFHVKDGEQAFGRIHIDPTDLTSRLDARQRAIEAHRHWVASLGGIEVSYERFVADRAAEARHILGFLRVRYEDLVTDWERVTPSDLEDAIDNYDEVCARLADTVYARWLDTG